MSFDGDDGPDMRLPFGAGNRRLGVEHRNGACFVTVALFFVDRLHGGKWLGVAPHSLGLAAQRRLASCLLIGRSDAPALRRRLRMFFLAMHRVERDNMARNIEFFQQFLHRRYLVGLVIDLDMRQHQRRIGGKSVEYLSGLGIVEGVETAPERLSKGEHLAVERHNTGASGDFTAVQVRTHVSLTTVSEGGGRAI